MLLSSTCSSSIRKEQSTRDEKQVITERNIQKEEEVRSNKMFTVEVQILSKKLGHDSRTILVDPDNVPKVLKEIEKYVMPLVGDKWIVGARKTGTKESKQISIQELTNIESKFYDQLTSGKLDKLVVSPPVIGG